MFKLHACFLLQVMCNLHDMEMSFYDQITVTQLHGTVFSDYEYYSHYGSESAAYYAQYYAMQHPYYKGYYEEMGIPQEQGYGTG